MGFTFGMGLKSKVQTAAAPSMQLSAATKVSRKRIGSQLAKPAAG